MIIINKVRRTAYINNIEFKIINKKPANFISCNLYRNTFKFLNFKKTYVNILWNDPNQEKLWLYNLHYFDYLLQLSDNTTEENYNTAKNIFINWINNNPIGYKNGWEPYPISLRVVNWIFFYNSFSDYFDIEPDFKQKFLNNLYQQTCYLTWFIEYHLMANHLWANIKALVFAGIFFNNKKWLKKGLKLLDRELNEQILYDGGHFEQSPMYHSIILVDILDLINLLRYTTNDTIDLKNVWIEKLEQKTYKMFKWLKYMIHPDGQISLFGDSAFNIAPVFSKIIKYAADIGINFEDEKIDEKTNKIIQFKDSGYFIFSNKDYHLIIDCGNLGPRYQPGHAHCDLLSYEYSYKRERFIVDTGVGNYLPSELRQKARSIYSHNTVVVNNMEQGEIWKAFRMGNRINPKSIILEIKNNEFIGSYYNNVDRKNRYKHTRTIKNLGDEILIVKDDIFSAKLNKVENLIHVHPDCNILLKKDQVILNKNHSSISLCFNPDILNIHLSDWFYTPEFGKVFDSKMIVFSLKDNSVSNMLYAICPSDKKSLAFEYLNDSK